MRALAVLFATTLLLGGCLQHFERRSSAQACRVNASHVWTAEGQEYTVGASTTGPDCERAVATLVVRDADGRALWTDAFAVEHVFGLRDARDPADMETALRDWVSYENTTMATSSALPEWPQGADGPQNGEFPFYPEPYFDRDGYTALRALDAPMLCYVQGMESIACLALEGGRLEKVGVQVFPG